MSRFVDRPVDLVKERGRQNVEVTFLWIQEVVRGSRVVVQSVAGDRNPANLLTKPHSACRIGEVVSWVGGRILRRRRCGPPSRIRWADVVEHEESDSADVWLTVDPRRDSTEGGCWEYSTHPAPSLCMWSVCPDAQHQLAFCPRSSVCDPTLFLLLSWRGSP